jgi:hypothetical protein
MFFLRHFFVLCSLVTLLHGAETREWTNAEGTKRFDAEFVSRENDQVTLLRADGQEISFGLDKLHADDQRWVNLNYPVGGDGKGEEMPAANAVFDTLQFGDNRETVSAKLKASKIVESSVEGIFQGRSGLNGIYRTKIKIGGLFCYLFFDWTESGTLREITLQTENQPGKVYGDVLTPCWEECIPLISSIHGKALQSGKIANANVLQEGQMLGSHIWRIEHGGTVILGTARQGTGYEVVVRFTTEKIEPNLVP